MVKITYRQYGGKSTLAKWIVSHFPEHKIYMEPFAGSCAVLFVKEPSFVETINDLDHRIINMFKMIRSNPKELAAQLWATPYSTENWRDVPAKPDEMDDARLLMAQGAQFYCGRGKSSTWAIDCCGNPHKPKSKVWADWFQRILPAATRLKDVQILCEDAIKAINRVADKKDALIYVDPPYNGHETEYRFEVDYLELVKTLHKCQAKVIVSEYPEAKKFFPTWRQVNKQTTGSARTGAHKKKAKLKTETLFFNF